VHCLDGFICVKKTLIFDFKAYGFDLSGQKIDKNLFRDGGDFILQLGQTYGVTHFFPNPVNPNHSHQIFNFISSTGVPLTASSP
jgi:hypothetical protein